MSVPRFPKHLIFYQIDDDRIFILRVVHGARDFRRPAVKNQWAAPAGPFLIAFFNAKTMGTQPKQTNAM